MCRHRQKCGRNASVAALPNGKVLKLSKNAPHIDQKYKHTKKKFQSTGKSKALNVLRTERAELSRILTTRSARNSQTLLKLKAKDFDLSS